MTNDLTDVPRTLDTLLKAFVCVCVPYLAMVRAFWFVCEDAFISFRFSKNLAMGNGPRFNVAGDELPVEGYSNFLWMLIAAAVELFGLNVTIIMPILSTVCGLGVVWLTMHTLFMRFEFSIVSTGMAGLMLALFTPFAVWTSSGLATMPMALLMVSTMCLSMWGDDRKAWIAAGFAGLGLSLIRVEGVYWAVLIIGLAGFSRHLRGMRLREMCKWTFGILALGYLPYFAWRFLYYQSLFANTVYAKISVSPSALASGLRYGGHYLLLMLSPILWLPGAYLVSLHKRRLEAFPFVAMALAVPLWAVVVGGEHLAFFRFMVPGMPFMAITIAFAGEWIWQRESYRLGALAFGLISAFVGVLPGFDVRIAPPSTLSFVQSPPNDAETTAAVVDSSDLSKAERDAQLFTMGESFELARIPSELRRWRRMRKNHGRWQVVAAALEQSVANGERLVAGSVGALGYYSMAYIYDKNGIVNREVARRGQDSGALIERGLHSYVEKDFFIEQRPHYLDYQVYFAPRALPKLRRVGERFNKEQRENYYPIVVPFSADGEPNKDSYVVLQARGSIKAARKGWQDFRAEYGSGPKKVSDRSKGRNKGVNEEFKPGEGEELPGGRWRTFTTTDNLSPEQREELEMLELIGYVAGSVEAGEQKPVVARYDESRAYNGLNLLASGHGAEATLVDMNGETLHSWSYAFDDVWPDYPIGESHDSRTYWRRIHLFPNGDLLAIFEGLGIIRIDKHSKLIWANPNRAHHDVRIASNGDVYTLTRVARMVRRLTKDHPILEDYLTILDAETGEEKSSVSILKAFEASDFDEIWKSDFEKRDIFHTNSLEILDGSAAAQNPAFKKGNILLSMRNINALAVMDPAVPKVVWALKGDFELQHDPKILGNGHLLLFNNAAESPSSVIEIDISNNEVVWKFEGTENEPFYTPSCGIADRFPNGNTLIVESDPGRAFEITSDQEVVWEFHNPHRAGEHQQYVASLFQVIRVNQADVPWLERR